MPSSQLWWQVSANPPAIVQLAPRTGYQKRTALLTDIGLVPTGFRIRKFDVGLVCQPLQMASLAWLSEGDSGSSAGRQLQCDHLRKALGIKKSDDIKKSAAQQCSQSINKFKIVNEWPGNWNRNVVLENRTWGGRSVPCSWNMRISENQFSSDGSFETKDHWVTSERSTLASCREIQSCSTVWSYICTVLWGTEKLNLGFS